MVSYIKTVIGAVLAVGAINSIFTNNPFGKYINFLSSVIVMTVLISPILNGGDEIKINTNIDTEILETKSTSYIMDEFENNLSQKIEEEMKRQTGSNFFVAVQAVEKENTVEIKEIEISPYSEEYAKAVSEYTGIKEGSVTEK